MDKWMKISLRTLGMPCQVPFILERGMWEADDEEDEKGKWESYVRVGKSTNGWKIRGYWWRCDVPRWRQLDALV
jgi:hypothetical protein